jgi:hypothetical protein
MIPHGWYAAIYQIKTEVTGIFKENATEEGTKQMVTNQKRKG